MIGTTVCTFKNPDPTKVIAQPKVSRLVKWRLFYPNCSNINLLCQAGSPAYLCAMTICRQHIW